MSPFSTKFGANERECIALLRLARSLKIELVGCSFHVGSRCLDPQIYTESLKQARRIFDIAHREEFGFKFTILDIGGGFSGHNWDKPSFPEVAKVIRQTLDTLFPDSEGVTCMSEPGRYFSSGGMVLVTRIIARRTHNLDYRLNEKMTDIERQMSYRSSSPTNDTDEKGSEKALIESAENIYYINDGIYGTFNAIIFDHKVFIVHYLRMKEKKEDQGEQFKSVIFGPTCDSIDCIAHTIDLPLLDIGDVLWFPDVGSYTNACASNFNGFQTKNYVFVWRN